EFRELAMHGSVGKMKAIASEVDVHELEQSSGRSALHKAAYWGHIKAVRYLLERGLDVNVQDHCGDTALHDATRFGHVEVAAALIDAGTNLSLTNSDDQTPLDLAAEYGKGEIAERLRAAKA